MRDRLNEGTMVIGGLIGCGEMWVLNAKGRRVDVFDMNPLRRRLGTNIMDGTRN